MITKTELIRRLHLMVDQLETFPEDWLAEGVYPLHAVTLVSKEDHEKRITLVVGIDSKPD